MRKAICRLTDHSWLFFPNKDTGILWAKCQRCGLWRHD